VVKPDRWIIVSDEFRRLNEALAQLEPESRALVVDYFLEIALGFEFGTASRIVRKWAQDVRVHVNGTLTDEDRAELDDVIADINALTSEVDIVQVDSAADVEVHFAPSSTFAQILPGYVPGNIGYFSVWWGSSQHIHRAVVLIATDVGQTTRNHIIREEITQMLGMGNDSFLYANSIFQQSFSTVTSFAPVDEAVIEILYRPELLVRMDESAAGRAARLLLRGVVAPGAGPASTRPWALPHRAPGSASGSAVSVR